MNALDRLNNLIQQAMGNQQSAREMKFNVREDDFALAGAYTGGQRGVTPAQALGNELQNFATQPLPQVAPNAGLPQINQGIQQLQQMQVPQGGGFGMAEGGSMGPQGPDFSPPGSSVIVGEGALNGDEEVVTRLNDGTVLVTPLKGGAATGATLPTPESSFGALSPLYSNLGFSDIPTFKSYGEGGGFSINPTMTQQGMRGPIEILNRLGIQPSLVKQAGDTKIYRRDPLTGQLQHIANPDVFARSGFNWNDVMTLQPNDFARYGTIGAPLTAPLPQVSGGQGYTSSTPFTTPFGQLLPNVYNAIGALNFAEPWMLPSFLSAYQNARTTAGQPIGIDPQTLMAMAQQPLPNAVPRSVLGYR